MFEYIETADYIPARRHSANGATSARKCLKHNKSLNGVSVAGGQDQTLQRYFIEIRGAK